MLPGTVFHPFEPVFDAHSRILILGSFPSVRSRETGFYYGHPQNRFWPLMARLFQQPHIPQSTEERRALVLVHGVALWDVIDSCEITGSSDASIRNALVNDIPGLLSRTQIQHIFCNGKQAFSLFQKHFDLPVTLLPSTSAANAAWSLDKLADAWQVITDARTSE